MKLGTIILISFLCVLSIVLTLKLTFGYVSYGLSYLLFFHFGLAVGWRICKLSFFKAKQLNLESKETEYVPDVNRGLNGLKDVLRRLVYKYYIRRKNQGFLVDISIYDNIVMQLVHRSHFPELHKSADDLHFGIALYIPTDNFSDSQLQILNRILLEDSRAVPIDLSQKFDYYIFDFQTRVRYGGHILSKILKDVFGVSDMSKLAYKVHDEDDLPYIGKKDIP